MPQKKRRTLKWKPADAPVSYKAIVQDKMSDASNVFTNQGVLETRRGVNFYNATVLGTSNVISLSSFQDGDDNQYILAKSGTVLYNVPTTGASTEVKTGLTEGVKHRGVTFRNRHYICAGSDGVFQYDGTTFTQLGQDLPLAPTAAIASGGSLTDAKIYRVAVTYYATATGFETNIGASSGDVTTASPNLTIDVSDIPATADNATIDKVRIYLKNVTDGGEWLRVTEINLGTTTYSITADTESTLTPPVNNNPLLSGGGKYPVMFGNEFVYAGSSQYTSDVFRSTNNVPDAIDYTKTLNSSGNGPITGLGVGLYNSDNLNPFLCIFKRNHIEVYSEIGGQPFQSVISTEVGCVSHNTIKTVNGVVYFMSTQGWHAVINGRLAAKKNGKPQELANDDLSDIFTRTGYVYELNKSDMDNYFSVYYPTTSQYMTFVSEGANSSIQKSYNYEFQVGGFRPYSYVTSFFDACNATNSSGEDIVLFAGKAGQIYKHSIAEAISDTNEAGATVAISALAQLPWISGEDIDATYNFGQFMIKALASGDDITITALVNYDGSLGYPGTLEIEGEQTGFILDVSKLDESTLSDGRRVIPAIAKVFRTGRSLMLLLTQNEVGANMNVIEAQLDFSKNGNFAI
jgi:hypothetical protein